MTPALWTVLCLFAYVCGLVIIVMVTPRVTRLSYDEGLFMAIAAADIAGAILAFGAVGITFAEFNGAFAVRVLDFLFLVGIFVVGLLVSTRNFSRRPMRGTFRVSRILAGGFGLFLLIAALYCIGLLFVGTS